MICSAGAPGHRIAAHGCGLAGMMLMRRCTLSLFALLLLFGCAFSNVPFGLHMQIRDLNAQMQPDELEYGNSNTTKNEGEPGIDDPVGFFGARILGALPEAEGRITSARQTDVFFGVAEAHARELSGEAKKDDECGPDSITLRSIGEPEITALLEFSYAGMRKEIMAAGKSGTVRVPFSRGELDASVPVRENGTNYSRMPRLVVELRARGLFTYSKEAVENRYSCRMICRGEDCYRLCGCVADRKTSVVAFEKSAEDYANYTVETGEPFVFVHTPVLGEQTGPEERYAIVVLSNRLLGEYGAEVGGEKREAALHNYSIVKNRLGVWKLAISEMNQTLVRDSSLHLEPAGLAPNANYSHAYLLEFGRGLTPGEKPSHSALCDDFGDCWNVSADFFAREMPKEGRDGGSIRGYAVSEISGSGSLRPLNFARMRLGLEKKANLAGFETLAAVVGIGLAGFVLAWRGG